MSGGARPIVAIIKEESRPDASRIRGMVREAVDLLGGVGRFVGPGSHVVIKTNIFAPYPPPVSVDRHTTAAVVELCRAAGARRVTVVEGVSVGTKMGRGETTERVMRELGVRRAVEQAGGDIVCLDDTPRVRVEVPGGVVHHQLDYPEIVLRADVLVDLCAMKTHVNTLITMGIKNFHGLLTDEEKYYGHRDDLDVKLVDILRVRQPDLVIVDGLLAMEGDGAGEYGVPVPMNLIMAGDNVVATDAVGASVMGFDPLDVPAVRIAAHARMGPADLGDIEVRGRAVEEVRRRFQPPFNWFRPVDRFVTGSFENVHVFIGGACPWCWLMTALIGRQLGLTAPRQWSVIVGSDPKVPSRLPSEPKHTIVLGDCACAATGPVKELRNSLLIRREGLIAPGCPTFRPTLARLEEYLVEIGAVTAEMLEMKRLFIKQKCFDYYRKVDPTWEPEPVAEPAAGSRRGGAEGEESP
ncbi:MAG TPA: hypothetical protein DHW14_05255 [Clostridiales bacterium]|nr:hypothetical protein [Clostridiales bacterium]